MTSMRTSAAGRKAIAGHEGNVLTAYQDSVGVLTIGVGHTSAAGPPTVKKGMKITAAESDEILSRDLAGVEADVNKLVKVPLSQSQFDALVSLVFNIGGTSFRKSTLLRKLNAGDYAGAADQFRVWDMGTVNGKKVRIKGLTTRRADERKLFLSEPVKASPVAPAADAEAAKGRTDAVTVRVVQERLKELGYTEVGTADGKLGKLTKTAILAFKNENDVAPINDVIDQAFLDALDLAKPRNLPREDVTPEVVRKNAPEVRTNWLIKIGALVAAIPAAVGGLIDGVIGNLGFAKETVKPLKEMFSDIPSEVWLISVAVIAGGAYLVARNGERKGIEAFRAGERR